MDSKVKQNYIDAGKVVQQARRRAREVVEPGVGLDIIAEEIEGLIRSEGLEPAFPVNISIDDQAAHYSPGPNEEKDLKSAEVVKIDIGAHKEGYIADTAITLNPSSKHEEMIETVDEVLNEALDFIEPGRTIGELGTFISSQVPEKYSIVRNLTGHYLDQYEQHAGISIPNIPNSNTHVIEEGDAIAVEPFITNGSGKIKNGKKGNIYIHKGGNVRDRTARKLLKKIKKYQGLPFSSRWLELNPRQKMALKKLVDADIVKHYPILKEVGGGIVSQSEHTILVGAGDDGNIVTTRE